MNITPYEPAIKATDKAITNTRLKHAKLQDELENRYDFVTRQKQRLDVFMEIGRCEAEIELFKGKKRTEAQKKLRQLNSKLKKLDNPLSFCDAHDKLLELEMQIERLEVEKLNLMNLQKSAGSSTYIFRA